MEKQSKLSPLAVALGTTFAVTLTATPLAHAQDNPFAAVEFQRGYMVAAEQTEEAKDAGANAEATKTDAKDTTAKDDAADKGGEGKCGGAMSGESKGAEGKCGS